MRYIPHTDEDIRRMLKVVGLNKVSELFDSIPAEFRLDRSLDLPQPLDEESLVRLLGSLAAKNTASSDLAVFLGAGAYNHQIPAAVDQLLLRGEFFTAYTPYQPEASQGTLQAIFEYQSMLASLTGCEVVNASMYDGATAAAEALMMALRVKRKRKRLLLSASVHPEVISVCRTYLSESKQEPEEIRLSPDGLTDLDSLSSTIDDQTAAVLVQQPNLFGCIEDLSKIAEVTHQAGAMLIVSVLEPVSLGLLEAPAKLGADIVTGEAMGLGSGLNFGGPGLGIFGCSQKNAWQMPGRLIGQTSDSDDRRGFVLTMATREQHIRRARATSNICTNEGLCALAAAIHLSLLGKNGFVELARINAANAGAALKRLVKVGGVSRAFKTAFFNEFVLKLDRDVDQVLTDLAQAGVIAGLPLGRFYPELNDCLLVCVTEMNTAEQVKRLAAGLEP
ncbi:MAG: aminomethyl-transferring glycine dehydrogenase subunit GcvPA [Deltaproteobacteria bacterium]|nr:aminomethyl-transferring glycine dehydrogenase subunit GcvPA [Deltaproteobacteria bacterium]MBW1872093.1 aminomethyl-transferring glycine dehydrogenase subunit GcvPA [Deltaproteobacteria bacterium]